MNHSSTDTFQGRNDLKFNRNVYQSLAMIGQFGINILVPVFACSFLGIFLDEKLGTSYLVILFFFLGAAAGFRNIYRFSRKIFEAKSSEQSYLHKGRASANTGRPPKERQQAGAQAPPKEHQQAGTQAPPKGP